MIKRKEYQPPKLSIIKMRQQGCLLETSASGIINAMEGPTDLD